MKAIANRQQTASQYTQMKRNPPKGYGARNTLRDREDNSFTESSRIWTPVGTRLGDKGSWVQIPPLRPPEPLTCPKKYTCVLVTNNRDYFPQIANRQQIDTQEYRNAYKDSDDNTQQTKRMVFGRLVC